jgi:hypothetical protein
VVKPSDLFASGRSVRISGSLMAMIATALAASVIAVASVIIASLLSPGGSPVKIGHIGAAVGIALFWAPAIAFIPAAVIGVLVERPKAKAMIERRRGGLMTHLLVSTLAGASFGLLFRLVLNVFDPRKPILDQPTLVVCTWIGFCSGVAWWYLIVLPGRRA